MISFMTVTCIKEFLYFNFKVCNYIKRRKVNTGDIDYTGSLPVLECNLTKFI